MGQKHRLAAIKKEIRHKRTNYQKIQKDVHPPVITIVQYVMLIAEAEYTGWLGRKKIWTSTQTPSRTVHTAEKF